MKGMLEKTEPEKMECQLFPFIRLNPKQSVLIFSRKSPSPLNEKAKVRNKGNLGEG